MAIRAAIDLVVVAAVAFAVVDDRDPPMPDELCTLDEPVAVEGRLAIVVAQLRAHDDPNAWTARELARRYPTASLTVVPDDEVAVAAALEAALRVHEVVYYTGHNFQGRLSFAIPDEQRTLIMDTCFSTQFYAKLARPTLQLITNDKPAITGSIDTLSLVLARASFTEINDAARQRASNRPPASLLWQAERYRRVCTTPRAVAGVGMSFLLRDSIRPASLLDAHARSIAR